MFDYFFAALIGLIILAVLVGGPARAHNSPAPRMRRPKKSAGRRRASPTAVGSALYRAPHRPA